MKKFSEVRAFDEGLGSDWLLSGAKVLGQPIVDVRFTVGGPYGDYCFLLHEIVLADGTTIVVQGEHDEVFLEDYGRRPELSEEQAEGLYREINAQWMEDDE